MSQSRRERRKLIREIKKTTNEPLDSIIPPDMGDEIRRRYLQRLKNEEISESDESSNGNDLDFSSNSGPSSYDGLKNLILKRDWNNY